MKYYISSQWIVLGATVCLLQGSAQGPQKPVFSTDQFKLLTQPRDFALQFESNGKTRQISLPRDWLIPSEQEKVEESNYVFSFLYGKHVTSFPIGNGKIGLQLSSYKIQAEGSGGAAAGRDVFLIFDPASSGVVRGGIERGITKQRVRSQGCLSAKTDHYFLADVDGDGLSDIGVVQEELQCWQKSDGQVDGVVGPFYRQYPVAWYVFKVDGWKLEPNFSGQFPERYVELPLIGIGRSPVDFVGCFLWRTCDRAKWPAGKNDQQGSFAIVNFGRVDGARATANRHPLPCCAITSINATTGVATAKVNATGQTFQLKVSNAALLNWLKTGQRIYANFKTKQVSLDGAQPCGNITSLGSGTRPGPAAGGFNQK